jgi:hypothetical protein
MKQNWKMDNLIIQNQNIIFKLFFIITLAMTTLLFQCSIRKSSSEKQKKCMQAYLSTYSPEEPTHYKTGGYEFRFSCSTEENHNPSCAEYFSRKSVDENFLCPTGYKKNKAKCSTQNIVGVCLETQVYNDTTDGLVLVSVFSQPFSSLDQAKTYCISPEKRGNFFYSYRTPNDTSSIEKQRNDALVLCLGLK